MRSYEQFIIDRVFPVLWLKNQLIKAQHYSLDEEINTDALKPIRNPFKIDQWKNAAWEEADRKEAVIKIIVKDRVEIWTELSGFDQSPESSGWLGRGACLWTLKSNEAGIYG